LKAEASTKDIPVVICTSRVLSNTERNQLNGKAVTILSKEGLDQSAVAQELMRVIQGTGIASAIQ